MIDRRIFVIGLVTTSATLTSASDKELEEYKKELEKLLKTTADNFRDNLPKLVAAAKRATKVRIYEGLPHQYFEKGQLESELKTKKTLKIDDYHFYEPATEASGDDGAALTAIFSDKKSFGEWQGPKSCGGFHPDYCVQWAAGDETIQALICFGCGEMQAQLGNIKVYCELMESQEKLKQLLTKYHKQRPPRKRGK